MPKLRVSVGGSYTDLSVINCNDELHPIEFDAPEFKGRAMIRIKDFVGITNDGSEPILNSDYFKGRNRKFSIQVEGRFKREWDGEQVYFGTDFDRSVELPSSFEAMFKIAHYIDPVVRTSLSGEGKPWILSPLVSSINVMTAWRPQDVYLSSFSLISRHHQQEMAEGSHLSERNSMWGFLGKLKKSNHSSVAASVNSHTSNDVYGSQASSASSSTEHLDILNNADSHHNNHHHLYTEVLGSPPPVSSLPAPTNNSGLSIPLSRPANEEFDETDMPLGQWRPYLEENTSFFMPNKPSMSTAQRRKYFRSEEARKRFVFKPELVHGFEFYSPHMNFNKFEINMGLRMNIQRYLLGQPVRYTCRTLDGNTVFWAVQFELVDE
ncbi:hypothetical protein BX616_008003 [Lobosporangium transversale]|uniref:Domain of unknown function at the cortex 1 domain-containing protein n=1 Tax=Lobosporangium transversale TaxID=64571 RepID=A0A1Y2H241_9FUNG|nr:hypothetical protein BCR41DRAFT_417771 [Lobosporangium transversale]KAF9914574.1 hypothetical protein BX616_008003 [Lobosporangium transversale]ORZ28627.1 hypothetical protein BCR41DRAFT_417771 [Lobosporangium transversale]|eukprot:XP_021886300.1 hypothetical protein BCR41DRAFT_417771 [Lobosporangium transversale]